ncbi:hypothetical protein [Streptomyces sp. YIM S03343]
MFQRVTARALVRDAGTEQVKTVAEFGDDSAPADRLAPADFTNPQRGARCVAAGQRLNVPAWLVHDTSGFPLPRRTPSADGQLHGTDPSAATGSARAVPRGVRLIEEDHS